MQLHEQAPAKVRSAADKRIAENKDSKLINTSISLIVKHININLTAAARWATVKVKQWWVFVL